MAIYGLPLYVLEKGVTTSPPPRSDPHITEIAFWRSSGKFILEESDLVSSLESSSRNEFLIGEEEKSWFRNPQHNLLNSTTLHLFLITVSSVSACLWGKHGQRRLSFQTHKGISSYGKNRYCIQTRKSIWQSLCPSRPGFPGSQRQPP